MSYWLEASLTGAPSFATGVLIVPVIEETAKFLAFRAIQKRDTLIAVLTFLFLETVSSAVSSGQRYDPAIIVIVALFGLGALKHVLFWAPEKLANFSIISLPVAITFHMLWNFYGDISDILDVIPAALLALATIPFLFLLFRESKSVYM